ncbi:MAG: hypothetical protein A2629_00135 [Candidatus Levybacteria bacterium RIFCSPHIGHO2_01_FULL_41_15]|nr:MAG: hypothetical protein A2629_00135 [Candidatus Levybacteria bacterium RIFCSPHIGHO2_01_FULL_41_15]
MIDPYRMVFVNLVSSILLLSGILIYRYIYPKRKINLFILLALISILPVISIFRSGTYESGDFNIHIYRIMSFYDSLRERNLMPSWASELNATYGNPLFIFNYNLPYYFISFFHFLGLSFITSMKIYLGLVFYLSGITMYFLVKEITNSKLGAFVSSIFYLFSPYHLIDVHFRATLGESTIFFLAPVLFYFIIKFIKEQRFKYFVICSLIMGLLFLAHPLLATVFLGIGILYILFRDLRNKSYKSTLLQLLALLVGATASIYVWISFILYTPYMFKLSVSTAVSDLQFYPFTQLIFSPWRYGLLFQGPKGELALIMGYVQIFVIAMSIIMIILKKIPKKIQSDYIFWIFLCIFFIFMMHPLSIFIWKYTNYQFFNMVIPYGRLSLAISFCISVITGYFTLSFSDSKIKKKFIYILLIITIGSTILNWGHRRVIPQINDSVLRKNVWISTITEGTTAYFLNNKWADINNFWFSALPEKHLEIINGLGTVQEIKRTSTKHTYIVNAQTPIEIQENTLYFPGWSLSVNSKNNLIYPGKRGVINAKLPAGLQKVELSYNDIPVYRFTKIISVSTFSILLIAFVFSLFPNIKRLTVLSFKNFTSKP